MNRLQLLMVEDDDDISKLIEKFLAKQGFDVTRAADGVTAVDLFMEGNFDVILLDTIIPKRNGFEVCSMVRKTTKGAHVGIVMTSAAFKAGPGRQGAWKAAGADAFFHKPFVVGEVRDKLAELGHRGVQLRDAPPKDPADRSSPRKQDARTTLSGGTVLPPHVAAARASSQSGSFPTARTPTITRQSAASLPLPSPASSGSLPAARRPVSSSGFLKPLPEVGPPVEGPVTGPTMVARALVQPSRQRRTGIVRLVDGGSFVQLAFSRGVPVGAWDNLREHMLGEALLRKNLITMSEMQKLNERIATKGERVAEALLSLNLVDAKTAFRAIEDQSRQRLRRALAWASGTVSFIPDHQAVDDMTVSSLDLIEEILQFALDPRHAVTAGMFLAERRAETVHRTDDFEEGLIAYAKLRPKSSLPGVLLGGEQRFGHLLEIVPPTLRADFYALWLAGLIRTSSEQPDTRTVPRPLRSADASTDDVDGDLASRVCLALLRARGRTYYELLGLPSDTGGAGVMVALKRISGTMGREALKAARLGPARMAANELWAILDEAAYVLSDPERRKAYDAEIAALRPVEKAARAPKPEADFLEGQMHLSQANMPAARQCFERCVRAWPNDPDYVAYLGWVVLLEGVEPPMRGIAILQSASQAHPQAMRSLFFLGLAAQRMNDLVEARAFLTEAARRAPDDVEVQMCLSSLGGQS